MSRRRETLGMEQRHWIGLWIFLFRGGEHDLGKNSCPPATTFEGFPMRFHGHVGEHKPLWQGRFLYFLFFQPCRFSLTLDVCSFACVTLFPPRHPFFCPRGRKPRLESTGLGLVAGVVLGCAWDWLRVGLGLVLCGFRVAFGLVSGRCRVGLA